MTAVTYGPARVPRDAILRRANTEKRRHFLTRFMDALRESRRQQARRVIENHATPLPNDPDSPVQMKDDRRRC